MYVCAKRFVYESEVFFRSSLLFQEINPTIYFWTLQEFNLGFPMDNQKKYLRDSIRNSSKDSFKEALSSPGF